ncbi:MAG: hypothetical protein WBO36_00700, partial [Saprospiraceae bacterium]
ISQSPDHGIVLGYGPLYKTGSLVNAFARYETTLTAMMYMTFSVSGLTYMGVGRNLMYRKALFYHQNGFTRHTSIASGDDDLLISGAATLTNVAIQISKVSFVYSHSKKSISSYLAQKSRHISTSFFYRPLVKFLLAGFAGAQLLFYFGIGLGLMLGEVTFALAILLLVSKWFLQMITQYSIFKRLSSIDLVAWFPVFDLLMMVYYLYLPMFRFFNKKDW